MRQLLLEKIKKDHKKIIDRIDNEDIAVYEFLRKKFRNVDVAKDSVFPFVFRSFYRMDNAGLTPEFKTEFFRIMQEYREKSFNMEGVLRRLGKFKTLRGLKAVQLSFVSKMYNMINQDKPIYDSHIARFLGLGHPAGRFDQRIDGALRIYTEMEQVYAEISNRGNCSPIIKMFDARFKGNTLRQIKKLDFIFWSAGKLNI